MKLILHIGLPKTGSTYLQSALAFNRKRLSSIYGIYWPISCSYKSGEGDTIGHHKFADSLKRGDLTSAKQMLLETVNEANKHGCNSIIISSEGLSVVNTNTFESAIDGIGLSEINIIAYLRHPADLILSWYSQDVHGQTVFTNLMSWHSSRKSYVGNIQNLQRWSSASKAKLFIRLYDRAALESGDILTDFCMHTFGAVSLTIDQEVISTNPSLKGNLLLIKRILNEYTFTSRVSEGNIPIDRVANCQIDEAGVWWHLFNNLASESRFKSQNGYPLANYEFEYLEYISNAEIEGIRCLPFIADDIKDRLLIRKDIGHKYGFRTTYLELIDDLGWILDYVNSREDNHFDFSEKIIHNNKKMLIDYLRKIYSY